MWSSQTVATSGLRGSTKGPFLLNFTQMVRDNSLMPGDAQLSCLETTIVDEMILSVLLKKKQQPGGKSVLEMLVVLFYCCLAN